jgi:transposase
MAEQKEKRTYTRECKLEAVRLYESSDKSMSEVERELGITRFLLSKWVQQTRREQGQAFPGKGHLTERDEELRRLQREVEVLKQERESLKRSRSDAGIRVIFSGQKR